MPEYFSISLSFWSGFFLLFPCTLTYMKNSMKVSLPPSVILFGCERQKEKERMNTRTKKDQSVSQPSPTRICMSFFHFESETDRQLKEALSAVLFGCERREELTKKDVWSVTLPAD
mmetsp:Transcript_13148/g.25875  ORF Transcript_13148/g.25875 Transcript_13148/m.25875 type:complete len:116 (-) Transcript_13148:325-672(-)